MKKSTFILCMIWLLMWLTCKQEPQQDPPDGPPDPPGKPQIGVTVSWAQNNEPDLGGYKVHQSTDGDSFSAQDVGLVHHLKVDSIDTAAVYYFYVTAYDTNGNESLPSKIRTWPDSIPLPQDDFWFSQDGKLIWNDLKGLRWRRSPDGSMNIFDAGFIGFFLHTIHAPLNMWIERDFRFKNPTALQVTIRADAYAGALLFCGIGDTTLIDMQTGKIKDYEFIVNAEPGYNTLQIGCRHNTMHLHSIEVKTWRQ